MSYWIHCHNCFKPFTNPFYITNCKHLFCDSCRIKLDVANQCLVCKQKTTYAKIDRSMDYNFKILFCHPKIGYEIITFQYQNMENLIQYFRKRTNYLEERNKRLCSEAMSLQGKYKELCKKYEILNKDFDDFKQNIAAQQRNKAVKTYALGIPTYRNSPSAVQEQMHRHSGSNKSYARNSNYMTNMNSSTPYPNNRRQSLQQTSLFSSVNDSFTSNNHGLPILTSNQYKLPPTSRDSINESLLAGRNYMSTIGNGISPGMPQLSSLMISRQHANRSQYKYK